MPLTDAEEAQIRLSELDSIRWLLKDHLGIIAWEMLRIHEEHLLDALLKGKHVVRGSSNRISG